MEVLEQAIEETGRKVLAYRDEIKAGLKDFGGRIDDFGGRVDKLEAKLDGLSDGARSTEGVKCLEVMLKQSKGYQGLQEQNFDLRRGQSVKLLDGISLKNTITSTQGETGSPSLGLSIAPDRHGRIEGRPLRPLRLLDHMMSIPVASNSLDIPRNNLETDASAPQAGEGVSKAESTYGFVIKNVRIQTIAHWVRASLQVLSDAAVLGPFLNNVLLHRVRQKLEDQIVNGNGLGFNFEGFLQVAPTIQTAGPTGIDRVGELLTELEVRDYAADAVLMHPRVWDNIRRTKATDNQYLAGSFANAPVPSVWGVPVISTRTMPETRILAGAFRTQAAILERSPFGVDTFRQDADNVTQNLVTLLAEGRFGLGIFDTQAFGQVNIGGSP